MSRHATICAHTAWICEALRSQLRRLSQQHRDWQRALAFSLPSELALFCEIHRKLSVAYISCDGISIYYQRRLRTYATKLLCCTEHLRFRRAIRSLLPIQLQTHVTANNTGEDTPAVATAETDTPDDLIATEYLNRWRQIEEDALERVKSCSSEFFEHLVVKLITVLGYGGSLADAGKAIGKSSDGGIDCIIKEDRLEFEQIYIQAKRWNNTSVGRPEIQKFVGALHGKRARKGIFLTTSTFTKDAHEYATGLDIKVILIDGSELAKFMFDFEVGISTESTYVVKHIDNDFFEDDAGSNGVHE
jgi:restriction endonuclease Mrr